LNNKIIYLCENGDQLPRREEGLDGKFCGERRSTQKEMEKHRMK